MPRTEEQIGKLAAVISLLLVAAAEARAQEDQARPARRIVVSIPDRKLALVQSGQVIKVFPAAVGKPGSPSPTGSFRIVQRLADPTWYTKGRIVAPGKANPLGTRWLGLSAKGYGIHGTNAPSSVGRNASHGCIRLRNRDVEELFGLVAVGDPVELYSQSTPELEQIFAPVAAAPAESAGVN